MSGNADLVIRHATCVTGGGRFTADIAIAGGRIAGLLPKAPPAPEEIDASGLLVLPGLVDAHVHFREPGAVHKEDLATGSMAAVLGGVTSVFEMPNTTPPTTDAATLENKLSRALGRMYCDHAFFIGATPDNAETLGALERAPGAAGVKLFMGSSTGTLLVAEDADIARVLAHGRRPVSVHAEDEARLVQRRVLAVAGDPRTHPVWRDAEAARRATERVLALARAAGRRVHILHVSTADELPLIAAARDIATADTTPNHLFLTAPEAYERLGARAQMNPPVRDKRHQDALWAALNDGTLSSIGSDHAPHSLSEKAGQYPDTPSGLPGVQTTLPLLLDAAARGRIALERVVAVVCEGPARIFGAIGKGRLAPGADADLVLVDPLAQRTIESRVMASRCGWTPYDGRRVTGWPVMTILRGRIVMREGEVTGPPIGRPVSFAIV